MLILARLAVLLFLILSLSPASAEKPENHAKDQTSDQMDLIFAISDKKNSNHDYMLCNEVGRSPAFDKWVHDFCAGNLVAAEIDWGELLGQLKKKGCLDCGHLISLADERTAFIERNGEQHNLLMHLLAATEHKVGPKDRYIETCCRDLARQFEGQRDYRSALKYRRRQVAILEEVLGKDSQAIVETRKLAERDAEAIQKKTVRPGSSKINGK